jgi:Cryptococcal mannosyltransferase 1
MYHQVPSSPLPTSREREASLPYHNRHFGWRNTKAQRILNEIRSRPLFKWLGGGAVGLILLSFIANHYNPSLAELVRPVPNYAAARVHVDIEPGLLTTPFPLEKLNEPAIPYALEYDVTKEPPEEPYWYPASTKTLQSLLAAAQRLTQPNAPSCQLTEWHLERYSPIINSTSPIFFALNLLEAESVMPTFFKSLSTLLPLMGPSRFYVSITENGSKDRTPTLLRILARMLRVFGTSYRIKSEGATNVADKSNHMRIAVLAAIRNLALQPLYDGEPGKYDTVLFINDVVHCPADILEVLYQHWKQKADMSCSVDWHTHPLIYDRWVIRSMTGHPYYEHDAVENFWKFPFVAPSMLPYAGDTEERERFARRLPTQVFSCWNGMAAMDARAFYPPRNIRFREATNDPEREHTDKQSECFLLPVDFWKQQMGKIQIVPRAA